MKVQHDSKGCVVGSCLSIDCYLNHASIQSLVEVVIDSIVLQRKNVLALTILWGNSFFIVWQCHLSNESGITSSGHRLQSSLSKSSNVSMFSRTNTNHTSFKSLFEVTLNMRREEHWSCKRWWEKRHPWRRQSCSLSLFFSFLCRLLLVFSFLLHIIMKIITMVDPTVFLAVRKIRELWAYHHLLLNQHHLQWVDSR